MYFPSGIATSFAHESNEPIIALAPNSRKIFFVLTFSTVTIWRVRPTAILASLQREKLSMEIHGANVSASWAPDGSRIVIQTALSHLVLVKAHRHHTPPYQSSSLPPAAQRRFLPGPGEAQDTSGYRLSLEGVVRIHGELLSVSPRDTHILFSTRNPPAVQRIPWPNSQNIDEDGQALPESPHNKWLGHDTWLLEDGELPWLVHPNVTITDMVYNRATSVEGWISSDGRAYFVYLYEEEEEEGAEPPIPINNEINPSEHGSVTTHTYSGTDPPGSTHTSSQDEDSPGEVDINWNGICVHGYSYKISNGDIHDDSLAEIPEEAQATTLALNIHFSTIAVGTRGGQIHLTNFPSSDSTSMRSHVLQPPSDHQQRHLQLRGQDEDHKRGLGAVQCMEWTSDGYALAVGWQYGWAVWSVGGRLLASGTDVEGDLDERRFEDAFMSGVLNLFWAPGNLQLYILAPMRGLSSPQLFSLPFARSAVTNQQSPDNTRYAVLQLDDAVMIYRGADQPDMSVINPEADVWQHVKIPLAYMAAHWPLRYVSISNDGRLLAVAGKRGLLHWSAISGRWKAFADPAQEAGFIVRGGMVWFNHVLVVGVEAARSYQVRLYSRDLDLNANNILHREVFPAPIVLLTLVDNSLLVYTADNTLFHYLVLPTHDTVKLHLCGSISFEGIVAVPSAVRGMSWMIPAAQKELGDPAQDLTVATTLLLVGGRLVLLRPRKVGSHEVKYDMQILAERIEFCWIHLTGIGALENSLWGYDGNNVRVWLDALTIEGVAVDEELDQYISVKESVTIPLNFYPLSVLMDKGIIIGVEHEAATRASLPFVMFRTVTSTHLFIHHVLRYHLRCSQVKEAVTFASNYQDLVFFAHALEVLLHTVIESDVDLDAPASPTKLSSVSLSTNQILPLAIEFLDHFDNALDVVVACARKTEVSRWKRLFDIVGDPKEIFEACLASGLLKTAGSYLLVLHNMEQLEETTNTSGDAIRLLRQAVEAEDWTLCRELFHFLRSIDESGNALNSALEELSLDNDRMVAVPEPNGHLVKVEEIVRV